MSRLEVIALAGRNHIVFRVTEGEEPKRVSGPLTLRKANAAARAIAARTGETIIGANGRTL